MRRNRALGWIRLGGVAPVQIDFSNTLSAGRNSEQERKTKRKEWNMKNEMNTKLVVFSSLALALAFWSPAQAQSTAPAAGKMMTETKMMDRCQEMKDQKQKMLEDMKAQDAELTEQLAKMNSAPDDKKVSLMAAVITRMVEQRIAMDARKAKMQEEMMQHMMQHMQMGKESMSQCPMMPGMKGMEDKSGDAQKTGLRNNIAPPVLLRVKFGVQSPSK